MEEKAHMVEQVIKYSDGSETVISYRGKIVDGVLIPNEPEEVAPKKRKTLKELLTPNAKG